jgi:hypothetical protein
MLSDAVSESESDTRDEDTSEDDTSVEVPPRQVSENKSSTKLTVIDVNKQSNLSRESSKTREGQGQQTITQFVRKSTDKASSTPNKGKQSCAPQRSPPTPVEVIHEQASNSKKKKKHKS